MCTYRRRRVDGEYECAVADSGGGGGGGSDLETLTFYVDQKGATQLDVGVTSAELGMTGAYTDLPSIFTVDGPSNATNLSRTGNTVTWNGSEAKNFTVTVSRFQMFPLLATGSYTQAARIVHNGVEVPTTQWDITGVKLYFSMHCAVTLAPGDTVTVEALAAPGRDVYRLAFFFIVKQIN